MVKDSAIFMDEELSSRPQIQEKSELRFLKVEDHLI
jgi:hypothetical protein